MNMLRWDVIVIGAGPAGSTSAALLADAGHKVLVLERTHFPRFHIGESLLPSGCSVLEQLGLEPDADTFHFKRGAQFISEEKNQHLKINFDEAYDGPPRHAWQVDRASFDTLLRDRAVEGGAEVRHGQTVTEVDIDAAGVRVKAGPETHRGRYLVDATGQGRFLARKARAIEPYKRFGKAAAFMHFDGVDPHITGEDGDIRIMMRPEGWAWIIPLPHDRLSVGIITQNKGATADMVETYAHHSPLLRTWTNGAESTAPQLISNFSYKNTSPYGARFVCLGDAACFLDPVFSSGVSLALGSAQRAVTALSPALESGTEADADLMAPLSAHMQAGYTTFANLIDRFYNTKIIDNLFFGAPKESELRTGIISVLAGDVWRDDNPFQRMLLRAHRRRSSPRYDAAA